MSDAPDITADQVAAWLRHNTEFFQHRQDVLEVLRLPDPRGEAVSLLERQARILRERNQELRERLNQLVDVARENDLLFGKTRQLTLSLIEARNPEQLFRNLVSGLRKEFGVDAVNLIVYDRDLNLTGEIRQHVRCLAFADLHEALQMLLRDGRAVCGVLRPVELEQLFCDRSNDIASAAMVPLHFSGPQGVLAIGSRDAGHFRSSLGTLFVSHIGDVLARRLAELLRNHTRLEARTAQA